MTMREKILAHFAEQTMYCDMFGSPLKAQLIKAISADYEQGGPCAMSGRSLNRFRGRRLMSG